MSGFKMQATLSKPIWRATCNVCKQPITFSPDKPLIQDEHEYVCYCGTKYWIDRGTGYYERLGSDIPKVDIKIKFSDL